VRGLCLIDLTLQRLHLLRVGAGIDPVAVGPCLVHLCTRHADRGPKFRVGQQRYRLPALHNLPWADREAREAVR
jgi:hypothetical protein